MERQTWTRFAVGGLLSAGLTLLGVAPAAEAQFDMRARPMYGRINLTRGFMPDPQVVAGNIGGPIPASNMQPDCRGYISAAPSHIVSTRSGFQLLRFVVSAQTDSTLVVMLPNGQVLCDDDGGEGLNPLIQTPSPPGDIRVWIGNYSSSGNGGPYQMGLTELGHITSNNLAGGPPVGGPVMVQPGPAGLNPNLPPMFGSTNLSRGFMPDPVIVSGMAGGPNPAGNLQGGCRGYISAQPSHVLTTGTGFQQIRFVVNAPVDTTLTVMLPNGQILCDDDGGSGLNPLIQASSPPGAIRVWVGLYSSSAQSGPYNLGYSELGHVVTETIPSPGGGGGGGGVVVRPPDPPADLVSMQADIPVTLFGPGMPGGTVAVWSPRGGPPTQISLQGRDLTAGGVVLDSVPPDMRDPVVTVTERRNGTVVARAEQPPSSGRDPGLQLLLLIRFEGRPVVVERWSGTAVQRGPRWSR